MRGARRGWAVATAGAVLGLCLVAVVLSILAAPAEPTGYGADAERVIVQSCTRARGGVGEDGCRCAYEALERSVAWERAVQLDGEVARGEPLPPDVADLVAPCWELGSGA